MSASFSLSIARFCRALPLAVLAFAAPLRAATEPAAPQRIHLFEQKQGGFFSYRIPGLVVTARGSVLAYCEARKFTGSDWDEIEQHLRRSTDGGLTWSPPVKVAHLGPRLPRNPHGKEAAENIGGPDEQTVNNPMAIAGRDGVVHYIYCVEYMRCFYLRSEDDGVSWSKPVEITPAFEEFRPACNWTRIATGPGHGIQLRSGRLVLPVWMAGDGRSDVKGAASVIYSDDNGATWHAGDLAARSDADLRGVSECIAAELTDGRVMLNIRNRTPHDRRAVSFSADGAHGWSKPEFLADLLEPVCMAGLASHPGAPASNGRPFLLFSNPDTLKRAAGPAEPGTRRDRENLTIKASYDGGRTWPVSRVLEPGPSAYSDLAVLPDGTILCFFESGRPGVFRPGKGQRAWPYATLTLARIDPAWLAAGAAGAPVAK